MKKQRIYVYGYGYVGQAVERFLKDVYDVCVIDPRLPLYSRPLPTAYIDAPAVICVPTPSKHDGSCDTSIVESIVEKRHHSRYLIKSTVAPGTTSKLNTRFGGNICFSPEYIGEGSYEVPWWTGTPHPTDMKKHTFHIFGGAPFETAQWVDIWSRVAGWVASYHQTDSCTAELTKYAENMFLAMKKTFCTELYLTAKAFNVDYREMRELWLLDERIGASMTLVWPDKLAFGGKCLPKDSRALIAAAIAAGHDPKLFRAVADRNAEL